MISGAVLLSFILQVCCLVGIFCLAVSIGASMFEESF